MSIWHVLRHPKGTCSSSYGGDEQDGDHFAVGTNTQGVFIPRTIGLSGHSRISSIALTTSTKFDPLPRGLDRKRCSDWQAHQLNAVGRPDAKEKGISRW